MQRLRAADHIVHAGDFTAPDVLEQLEALGPPVTAVHGNVDAPRLRRQLPERCEVELDGVVLGITHDAGPAAGRLERMRRAFPGAAAIVFGHSHVPLHERGADGFQIFNPGSPTDRRRQPQHTMGIGRIVDGAIAFELVDLRV